MYIYIYIHMYMYKLDTHRCVPHIFSLQTSFSLLVSPRLVSAKAQRATAARRASKAETSAYHRPL